MNRMLARALTALTFALMPGLAIGLILTGNVLGWLLILPALVALAAFLLFWREGVFDD